MPYTAAFASAICLTKIPEPQHLHVYYVVSGLSQFYFLPLADLSSLRVPTFHLPDIYFIFLGSRHCITFWPPGPLRPGGLSRSPSWILLAVCGRPKPNNRWLQNRLRPFDTACKEGAVGSRRKGGRKKLLQGLVDVMLVRCCLSAPSGTDLGTVETVSEASPFIDGVFFFASYASMYLTSVMIAPPAFKGRGGHN